MKIPWTRQLVEDNCYEGKPIETRIYPMESYMETPKLKNTNPEDVLTVEDLSHHGTVDDFVAHILEWGRGKGWNDDRNTPTLICLMHSELSEALEEHRKQRDELYFEGSKPEGTYVELADCVIRIMHFFAMKNVSLQEILAIKMKYNETRPFRHGGRVV